MIRVSIDVFYHNARLRIVALLAEIPPETYNVPVAACPGWRVRDVVGHLTGIVEDSLAGRMTQVPPDEMQTADEVARYCDLPFEEVLERWEQGANAFEEVIGTLDIWQAAVDILSHEHDIRAAVGRPGARDAEGVEVMARRLLRFKPPVPFTVQVENAEFHCGDPAEHSTGDGDGNGDGDGSGSGTGDNPADSGTHPEKLVLNSTYWDVLRWRMGRRSRTQLAAMDWSRDPGPALDHLVVFGPALADIIE